MLGFDETTARTLMLQSVTGATAVTTDVGDISFATIRQNVTSKEGTAAVALQIFAQQEAACTVASATQAAVTRAEEMENYSDDCRRRGIC